MILDLFAGPGGWDEGLALIGVHDVIGVEVDEDAADTAEAAGHKRIRADVRDLDPTGFGHIEGLIASPPCQTFSAAGNAEGQSSLFQLGHALSLVASGTPVPEAVTAARLDDADPRSSLILEPLRYARELTPAWIVMEEVPPVLAVWHAYASHLRVLGYSTWAGVLNAADYGLPQARRRAILIATRGKTATPPQPTHARNGTSDLFGGGLPWITMAEALDLGPRPTDETAWAWDRPATTVVRSFRPDIISAPGYRGFGDPSRQNAPGAIPVTPEQMCVLQGIRTDYPFSGSPSKRLSLIGAILPPPWAAAILRDLVTDRALAC